MDEGTKTTLQKIPLLKTRAGPRDGDAWVQRLKEELTALISYVKINKEADHDWFQIESNKLGTRWTGKCWYVHNFKKYEFDLEFEIPVGYPTSPIEMQLPELEGRTVKMYRGGKICLTIHFKPLWAKNAPHFGIAHALAMGVRIQSDLGLFSELARYLEIYYSPDFRRLLISSQLAPWLAAEIPHLIETNMIKHKEDSLPTVAPAAVAPQPSGKDEKP